MSASKTVPHKPLIEVRDLVKVYKTPAGEFTAIKGLDVVVRQGEFVAVIGKSGSGKSTFINMLTGIDRPTSGEIFIGGAPIHTYDEGQMAVWRGGNLGIVFQFFQLIPTLTVIENVILPMELNNLYDRPWRYKRALHLLKKVEMEGQADKLPAAISGGQQQRVAIARALANDPPLIVADEPTGNLDTKTAEKIFSLFEDLVASGKTVLMVTHDSDLARRVDRTILISNGEIVNEYLVQALSTLTQDQIAEVARQVTPRVVPPDASIIRQGETGDKFYILVEGRADVLVNAAGGGQILVDQLQPGNYFGEMALLGDGIRAATVKAANDSEAKVVELDNAAFNELIKDSHDLREELGRIVEQRAKAIQLQAFSVIPEDNQTVIAQRHNRKVFPAGHEIIRQGGLGGSFHIIEDGKVDIFMRNSDGDEIKVGQLTRGGHFGGMALLGEHRHNASVRVSLDGPVHCIEFSAQEFERLTGSSEDPGSQVEAEAQPAGSDSTQDQQAKGVAARMSESKRLQISLRSTKILRDLWVNKARSLLIVLAVTVGVSAFGLMISGSIVLEQNLADVYAATDPAHATVILHSFDDGLVSKVGDLSYVQNVQARRLTQAQLERSSGEWLNLDLVSVPDFEAISINRLSPAGTAPPDSILLEESLQGIAQIGESVRIRMLNGDEHTLKVAGFVNDLSILPAGISLMGSGYISMNTARSLGLPVDYNRLYVRFKDASNRTDMERKSTSLTGYLEEEGYGVFSAQVPQPEKYVLAANMTSVLFILQSLGLLTLVLSALLVTSVMSAVIAQQIPQIGILKSLGARFRQMMAMYFQQVLVFGVVALTLAIPIGLMGAYFLAGSVATTLNFHVPHFYLPWPTVLLQAVSALLVPLAASSIPIVAGARMTIREAISGYRAGDSARLGWFGRSFGTLPQLVNISLRNAFRRKGRLALAFSALVLAGAMFIAILGIRRSLGQAVEEIQGSLNYDVGVNFDRPYPIALIKEEALKVKGIDDMENWLIADGRIAFEDDWLSGSFVIQGVPADTEMAKPGVITGRWLGPNDRFALFVNSEFLALSPGLPLGSRVKLRIGGVDHEWTLVGTSARTAFAMAYVHYADLAAVTGLNDSTNRLVVSTESDTPEFQARVQTDLSKAFDLAGLQVIGTDITAEAKKSSAAQLDSIIILLMSMVILVAIVGGLGLAITMGLNVLERTREIGILRSLGAQNYMVRRVVIFEGLVIGLVSWAGAIPLSIPLAVFLGNSLGISLLARPLDYIFSVPAVLLWLALVILISIIASALPGRHAARLTIRDFSGV